MFATILANEKNTYCEDWYNIHMTIQKNRWLGRFSSYPCKNHDRFLGIYMIDFDRQIEGLRLSM